MGWLRKSTDVAGRTDAVASWGERAGKILLWIVGPSTLSAAVLGGLGWLWSNALYGTLIGLAAFALTQLGLTLLAIRRSAVNEGPFAETIPEGAVARSLSPADPEEVEQLNLELFPGELMLTYEPDYSLRLHSNFTLFNKGALPGALIYLEGTISSASGDNEARFRWLNFTQSLNISEPGEEVKPWLTFSGWVEPVTIPGRSATVKGILLYTSKKICLSEGDYRIEFIGTAVPAGKDSPKAEGTIHISREQAEHLRNNCVRNSEGIFDSSLRVPWSA